MHSTRRNLALRLSSIALAICLVVGMSAAAFAQAPAIPADWKKVDETTYSIQYPKDWEVKESEAERGCRIMAPMLTPQDFYSNLHIKISDKSQRGLSLDEWVTESLGYMKPSLGGKDFSSTEKLEGPAGAYYKVTYDADDFGVDVHYVMYYFMNAKQMAGMLTWRVGVTRSELYQPTIDSMIGSFQLK